MTSPEDGRARAGGWFFVIPALALMAVLGFGLSRGGNASSIYVADGKTGRLIPEKRKIDLSGTIEEKAAKLVSEFLLGPMEHAHSPILPGELRLGTVMHRAGILHVGIRLSEPARQIGGIAELKRGMELSLASSLPGSGRLILYVDGIQAKEP
ncbi:MAG TPA: hypothetical protein VIO60_03590 [Rectinemataceae bacterium]